MGFERKEEAFSCGLQLYCVDRPASWLSGAAWLASALNGEGELQGKPQRCSLAGRSPDECKWTLRCKEPDRASNRAWIRLMRDKKDDDKGSEGFCAQPG